MRNVRTSIFSIFVSLVYIASVVSVFANDSPSTAMLLQLGHGIKGTEKASEETLAFCRNLLRDEVLEEEKLVAEAENSASSDLSDPALGEPEADPENVPEVTPEEEEIKPRQPRRAKVTARRRSDKTMADYNDDVERYLFYTRKRSCIRRGATCDHRPSDCCYSATCRCNLWGTNCRCTRTGLSLFQKWGRR